MDPNPYEASRAAYSPQAQSPRYPSARLCFAATVVVALVSLPMFGFGRVMQEGNAPIHPMIAMAGFGVAVSVAFYYLLFGLYRTIQWLNG